MYPLRLFLATTGANNDKKPPEDIATNNTIFEPYISDNLPPITYK